MIRIREMTAADSIERQAVMAPRRRKEWIRKSLDKLGKARGPLEIVLRNLLKHKLTRLSFLPARLDRPERSSA